ncbi:P-loop containing nucleoside triphosphate hydrolase protein [Gongronella butleri]|nr:P-loop containing nucleoside triphosphate hydrolase protein [Gongronella butleri]
MESHAVPSTLQTIRSVFNQIFGDSFLESWIGPQWLRSLSLLFQNDAVIMGLYLMIGPSFLKFVETYYYRTYYFIMSQLYVTIEIDEYEVIYTPISKFIARELKKLKLQDAQAGIDREGNGYSRNRYVSGYLRGNRGTKKRAPAIQLQPLLNREIKLKYDGRTFWIMRSSGDGANNIKTNLNPWDRMFGAQKVSFKVVTFGRDVRMLKDYLSRWMEDYYSEHENKLLVYKCEHQERGGFIWEEDTSKEARDLDTVILRENLKETILNGISTPFLALFAHFVFFLKLGINFFMNNKEWYADKGIPYRHGFLLKGPPGTGKTSVCRSLASTLELGLAVVNLTSVTSDEELAKIVSTIPADCLLLMEDVDHCLKVIEKTNNTANDKGTAGPKHITLPGLLAMLDGYDMTDGTVFFMTCNDETVLPAVMRRRGRVDQEITLDYADSYQIETMFARFFKTSMPCEDNYEEEKKGAAWQRLTTRLANSIPPGEVTTAELQGLFLDYSFQIQDQKITEDSFNDLFDTRIGIFLKDVKAGREISMQDRQQKLNVLTNRLLKKKSKSDVTED